MTVFEITTVVIVLTALFSFINSQTLRLPTTIGVLVIALLLSLVLVCLGYLGFAGIMETAASLLQEIDFSEALMHGMLSFLLFAGALHINLNDLARQKWIITILATVGILVSTLIIGSMTWLLCGLVDLPLPFLYCLLFGALISPTDPVAVLGLLTTANAPKSLEIKIAGESLFNDGIGVVVFLVLLGIAKGGQNIVVADIFLLFLREAVGGIIYGLLLGILTYQMLKRVNNYQVEILITLATVMGGYALADVLHTSGPIAIVVTGLLIGNHGRSFAMSEYTRDHLDTFWELIDQILNAVLFMLIGMEMLVMDFTPTLLLVAVCTIPIVLAARLISVGSAVSLMKRIRSFTPGAVTIMVWGGLRGGISVALALSLPTGPQRTIILAITYVVVVFSIVVQGLTIGKVVRRVISQT